MIREILSLIGFGPKPFLPLRVGRSYVRRDGKTIRIVRMWEDGTAVTAPTTNYDWDCGMIYESRTGRFLGVDPIRHGIFPDPRRSGRNVVAEAGQERTNPSLVPSMGVV